LESIYIGILAAMYSLSLVEICEISRKSHISLDLQIMFCDHKTKEAISADREIFGFSSNVASVTGREKY
jgi:hypothetical protein